MKQAKAGCRKRSVAPSCTHVYQNEVERNMAAGQNKTLIPLSCGDDSHHRAYRVVFLSLKLVILLGTGVEARTNKNKSLDFRIWTNTYWDQTLLLTTYSRGLTKDATQTLQLSTWQWTPNFHLYKRLLRMLGFIPNKNTPEVAFDPPPHPFHPKWP